MTARSSLSKFLGTFLKLLISWVVFMLLLFAIPLLCSKGASSTNEMKGLIKPVGRKDMCVSILV